MNRTRWLYAFSFSQSLATMLFLYGEPFYARRLLHWGQGAIGASQALSGACIAVGSFVGGRIAHRVHPAAAIRAGLVGSLAASLLGLAGLRAAPVPTLVASLGLLALTQAFVWPAVEAALTATAEREAVAGLLGTFNLVWSAATATAYLIATPLMAGAGLPVVFWLPALLFCVHFAILPLAVPAELEARPVVEDDAPSGRSPAERDCWRRMGWIANPFGYLAILTIVTFNPILRTRLGLSFASASAWCSVWFYVRSASFELLRRWHGWQYQWQLLCLAFALAALSFVGIVLAPSLPALLAAQALFGLCVGLMYISSIYYSMHESDAHGEHGGLHEAFIGIGNMSGPLIIAACAAAAPALPKLPVAVVAALMAGALMVLIGLGVRVDRLRRAAA